MTSNDLGEALFEQYATERGYQISGPDVDLGTGKKPDYLVGAAGQDLVVEVESFEDSVALPMPGPGGFVAGSDVTRVRDKIKFAARQLKGINGRPLVVVLANPRNVWVPLTPPDIIQAMYGDFEVTFSDSGMRWGAGRNGRLHVREPDGRERGFHGYVSAVCVVQQTLREDAAVLSQLNSASSRANALYVISTALADGSLPTDVVTRLDVFEAVSETAMPLPRNVFNGPYDTRWGVTGVGTYGRLSGGRPRAR